MHLEEFWLPVNGFPNYEVSSHGRVWNHVRENLVKPQRADDDGYYCVRLCNHGVRKSIRLNRLVAAHFIGPVGPRMEVNHIDGVKTNNCVENLEIVTHAQNIKHAYDIGLMKPPRPRQPVRDLTTGEVFESVTAAAKSIGTRQGNVSNVLNGLYPSIRGHRFERVV